MPSFDVVSEVDFQEVRNAVDQANREIHNRYDFKGSDARVEQSDNRLTLCADDDYKVGQAMDILQTKLAKRKVDLGCLKIYDIEPSQGGKAKQEVLIRHGVDVELARNIVKQIKNSKMKVQASIQGDRVRISGKKRDDLQNVISMLRGEDLDLPLQYINFRD
ncbi:MAG: YajQ family cyclic di-GMP-binding protein [Gammaproteobacteria bacterium]|nr:YajQ family cyclic di-GMP-binding protein [Gammaproteobacteria bacterium]